MLGSPRVTVVMPTYNCSQYLDDAIRSVVAQTFTDWELVIVDDGSVDQTPDLILRWQTAESRIRGFSQANSGTPATPRNRGIREARGTIIAFLDGDDLYHPEKLACVVQLFDSFPEVAAAFHDYIWFHDGSPPDEGLQYLEHERFVLRAERYLKPVAPCGGPTFVASREIIKFMSSEIVGIHTSAIAIRSEALRALEPQPPFDETLPHGEDIDLWLRIARQLPLGIIARVLSYYRHREQSWMATQSRQRLTLGSYLVKSRMLCELERMLTPEEWPSFRDRVAAYWQGLGYQCLVAGLKRQARRGFRETLRLSRNPRITWLALKGIGISALPHGLMRRRWERTLGAVGPAHPHRVA